MKTYAITFDFELVKKIRHIPGTLQTADFRRLLEELAVEDASAYSDHDVQDIALMALQDRGHHDSVSVILSTLFAGQFTPGQAQNLTEELKEVGAWDEYSDLLDHRALYACVDIMNSAFPVDYPEPSLTHLRIGIHAGGMDSFLTRHPLDEAMLLRGIGRSEAGHCLLSRLFADQLNGSEFPEAKWIIWLMESNTPAPDKRVIDCYGSGYWFRGIQSGMESVVDFSC